MNKIHLLCLYTIFLLSLPLQLIAELPHTFKPSQFWDQHLKDVTTSTEKLTYKKKRRTFFQQWFTGPLMTPSPITINPKTPAIGLGLAQYYYYGNYDNKGRLYTNDFADFWSTQYIVYPMVGLTKKLGAEAFGILATNYNRSKSSTNFLDTIVRLGYQILADKLERGNWVPDLRIIAQEILPTGNFRNLDSTLEGIDSTGQGSYQTGLYLAWQKGFNYDTKHAFNLAGAFGYFLLSKVKIKGMNYYGGTPTSEGTIYPGNLISIFSSGEFELTKHVAFAYDSNCRIYLSGEYKSNVGNDKSVKPSQMVIFEFTPELEITFTEKSGILVGPWFTIAGQNSPAFVSVFIAYMALF